MSRILLTGGSGALVSAITDVLLKDATTTIVILDKNPTFSTHLSNQVHVVAGDYTNTQLLSDVLEKFNISSIIDCSSQSERIRSGSPTQGAQVALQGLTKMLDSVREYGKIESFVLLSSQAVYGQRKQIETEPLAPNSFFGAAMMGAEAMLHSYVISYKIPAAIVRVTEGIIERVPENLSNLSISVNLVSASDVAEAIVKILLKAKNGRIFNVGGLYDYDLDAIQEALSAQCFNSLKERKKESALSTKRLEEELDFVIRNEFGEYSKIPKVDSHLETAKTKILLFSEGNRNISSEIEEFITKHEVVQAKSSPGYDDDKTVQNEIIDNQPNIVLWVAKEKDCAEEYEGGPEILRKNLNDNLLGPWLLASYCHTMELKFVFVNIQNTSPPETASTSLWSVKNFAKPLLNHFPKTVYLNSSISNFKTDINECIKV